MVAAQLSGLPANHVHGINSAVQSSIVSMSDILILWE
jgi:hypothetical protein